MCFFEVICTKHFAMRKMLLSLICATSFLFGRAQVFNAENCFHVGTQGNLAWTFLANSYSDALLNTSFNHTWDLSGNFWTDPTGSYVFETGEASGNATFINSEIHESGSATFSRDLFFSYSDDQDTLYYDGISLPNNYAYSPAVPYLSFPLNQGDSVYHFQLLYAMIGGQPQAVGNCTRTWKYDGYGTIIFPYGTQENCYRIKTTQIDSTFVTNFGVAYDEIIWFRSSDGLPVLRYMNQGGFISCYYAGVDGVSTVEEVDFQMSVYPNPATDFINIQSDKMLVGSTFSFCDQLGRNVYSGTISTSQIDISSMQKGLYLFQISDNSGIAYRKKMIIR